MFVDRAEILLRAGDGGNGCLAFRREKYVPRGGPSGGNGGRGGNIYFRCDSHLNTLQYFRYRQHFKAPRGGHGSGSDRRGKDGQNVFIEVPVGTQVYEEASGGLLCDLLEDEQAVRVATGGRGGRGNAAFATATNQAPHKFEEGQPGQQLAVILKLKILADAGLIGLPNAGKSTLISAISSARSKAASYPFTTLTPHLGVVSWQEYYSFVVADIPGLIKGSHGGSGLGDRFLRHVERTRLLVHLVDVSESGPSDPVEAYRDVAAELECYDPALADKPQVVVASKMDIVDAEKLIGLRDYARARRLPFLEISAASGQGLPALTKRMAQLLEVNRT